MIEIKDKTSNSRICNACQSDDDVKELVFSFNNGNATQGRVISLCKNCRKELNILIEHDFEIYKESGESI